MAVRISVAMCTKNCASYLDAQLRSIAAQTRQPDELVVADEASSDASHDILLRFAADAPFPVTVIRNPAALGVSANFTQVIRRCSGDLIALCDHDDVWYPERLEASAAACADPSVSVAFSDATLIDATGASLPGTLWGTLGIGPSWTATASPEQAFSSLLARRVATGGTMTLRADVAQWALPIQTGWYQDEWLAQLAALRGRLQPIARPLMQYRQHAANAVGAQTDGTLARLRRAFDGRRVQRLEQQARQLKILAADLEARAGVPRWTGRMVAQRLEHTEARLRVRGGPARRLAAVWQELRTGRYTGDAMGSWSALQDLFG